MNGRYFLIMNNDQSSKSSQMASSGKTFAAAADPRACLYYSDDRHARSVIEGRSVAVPRLRLVSPK